MIKHTMHVQSLHCSIYLTWLDVCMYMSRSHFYFLNRKLGKANLVLHDLNAVTLLFKYFAILKSDQMFVESGHKGRF